MGSLSAAQAKHSTRYCQLAITSGFIKRVWPSTSWNIKRVVSDHIMRGLIPLSSPKAQSGSANRISQARATFNPCGDQVLSKSLVMNPTKPEGLNAIHLNKPTYSSQIPKKTRIPQRKKRRESYLQSS